MLFLTCIMITHDSEDVQIIKSFSKCPKSCSRKMAYVLSRKASGSCFIRPEVASFSPFRSSRTVSTYAPPRSKCTMSASAFDLRQTVFDMLFRFFFQFFHFGERKTSLHRRQSAAEAHKIATLATQDNVKHAQNVESKYKGTF